MRFRNTNGTVVETPVTVPARGRAVVDPKAVSGMGHPYFSTDVIVLNGVGLVAERAMYFFAYPNWTASHISLGKRY